MPVVTTLRRAAPYPYRRVPIPELRHVEQLLKKAFSAGIGEHRQFGELL